MIDSFIQLRSPIILAPMKVVFHCDIRKVLIDYLTAPDTIIV